MGEGVLTWEVDAATPEEMAALGRAVGAVVRAGDVLLLSGALGAGKTVFASGVLTGLGVPGPHPSPTFTLVRLYRGRLPAAHLDLYRLGKGAATEDLGWDELLAGGGVAVVEWSEYLGPWMPEDGVGVVIAVGDGGVRRLRLTALGPAGERVLVVMCGARAACCDDRVGLAGLTAALPPTTTGGGGGCGQP